MSRRADGFRRSVGSAEQRVIELTCSTSTARSGNTFFACSPRSFRHLAGLEPMKFPHVFYRGAEARVVAGGHYLRGGISDCQRTNGSVVPTSSPAKPAGKFQAQCR